MHCRLLLIFLLLTGTGRAQTQRDTLHRFRLDACYGYAWNFTRENIAFHRTAENSRYVVVGPVGARFEYQPSRWIGIGGELMFTHASHRYQHWNGYDDVLETFELSLTELRILPFLNFYLVKRPRYDFFLGIGGGYRYASFRYEVPESSEVLFAFLLELPYAVRLGGGMRFYFSEHMGIHITGGLEQGGTVGGGLTWKW